MGVGGTTVLAETQRSAAPSNPAIGTSHSSPLRPGDAGRSGLVPRCSGGDRPCSAVMLRPNAAPHHERSGVQGVGHHRRCVHDLLGAALAGFALPLRRTLLCLRERRWSPIDDNTLLFSWSTAAVLVFGASSKIPAGDLIVTEEPLGDLILRNWCPVEEPAPCISAVSNAITWQTYLQSSFTQGGPAPRQIMPAEILNNHQSNCGKRSLA
jgi:hypothetical protein